MKANQEIIELKLTKAKQLFSEVEILIDNSFFNTAINRLYYSCFHATKALLLTKDLIPKTHSGTATILHQHFVLTKEFQASQASFFGKLMQERIEDDYNDFMIIEAEGVNLFLHPAKEYLIYVESLIQQYLDKPEL